MKMIVPSLALLLAACAATDTSDPAATRAWLKDFAAQYSYDTGYMERLLDLSPAAYDTFAAAMGMAEHRVHLPVDAHYVGCISALLADDCGACTQLNLRMAVEAGVHRALLRQLLEDPDSLPPVLRMVHDYATQVVRGGNADAARVQQLRWQLGDEGFAELAVNVLGCRIYPGLRRAMGAEVSCPPPTLDF
ncbi:MAG TPA: hypothetical protein VFZ65_09675 [Planctomycetota bacterium]|nr:hypothetical protein [Planctomycetota bacterium]